MILIELDNLLFLIIYLIVGLKLQIGSRIDLFCYDSTITFKNWTLPFSGLSCLLHLLDFCDRRLINSFHDLIWIVVLESFWCLNVRCYILECRLIDEWNGLSFRNLQIQLLLGQLRHRRYNLLCVLIRSIVPYTHQKLFLALFLLIKHPRWLIKCFKR